MTVQVFHGPYKPWLWTLFALCSMKKHAFERNMSVSHTGRNCKYGKYYLHFSMFVPSINQTRNILYDSVTQLGWVAIHVSTNYNSISRLCQMFNELSELVRLDYPMGQVLSSFIVFCMHLDKKRWKCNKR